MLYLITSHPGDDMGNVVSWRDFKKPENVSQENFRVEIKSKIFVFKQVSVPNPISELYVIAWIVLKR